MPSNLSRRVPRAPASGHAPPRRAARPPTRARCVNSGLLACGAGSARVVQPGRYQLSMSNQRILRLGSEAEAESPRRRGRVVEFRRAVPSAAGSCTSGAWSGRLAAVGNYITGLRRVHDPSAGYPRSTLVPHRRPRCCRPPLCAICPPLLAALNSRSTLYFSISWPQSTSPSLS